MSRNKKDSDQNKSTPVHKHTRSDRPNGKAPKKHPKKNPVGDPVKLAARAERRAKRRERNRQQREADAQVQRALKADAKKK